MGGQLYSAPIKPRHIEQTVAPKKAPGTTDKRRTVPKNIQEPKMLVLAPTEPDYVRRKQHLKEQFHRDLLDPKEQRERYKRHKEQIKSTQKATYKDWLEGRRKEQLTISEMNYDQMLRRKNELILEGNYEVAIKYLEKMLPLTESPDQLIFIMLELAELFMKIDDFARSERMFIEFVKLYPGNEFVEQSYVKAIECSWKQTAIPERDQTKTEETLTLIDEFLAREIIYSKDNVAKSLDIKNKCYEKLAESSMEFARQYMIQGIYRSAHKRLDDIRDNDLKKLPSIEPQLLHLELQLAQAENDETVKKQKLNEMQEKFPKHDFTVALNEPKKSWFSWFA